MSGPRAAGYRTIFLALTVVAALVAACGATPAEIAGGNGATPVPPGADPPSGVNDPGDEPAARDGSNLPPAGTLPGNFPPEIPLPDGYHLIGVIHGGSPDGASSTFFVELYSTMSEDELLAFFRERLPSSIGWNETGSEERDGLTSVTFEPEGEQPTDRMPSGLVVQVAESDVDGYRVVNLQIHEYPT
jgi:hypothetical protein